MVKVSIKLLFLAWTAMAHPFSLPEPDALPPFPQNTHTIRSAPMQPHQAESVKNIIYSVAFKLWPNPRAMTLSEFIQKWQTAEELYDIDNAQSVYFDNNGIFLVLLDGDTVVGSGAIRKITDEMCELKRLWLLEAYQGKRLGLTMTCMLLDFAQQKGYKKVCLDVCYPEAQMAAVALYKKLGFYVTKLHSDSSSLFMEKVL